MSTEPIEENGKPRPWHKAWWTWDRLEELFYQGISWPYIVSLALTWLFFKTVLTPTLHSQSIIVGGVMVTMWTAAIARRSFEKWAETRK